MVYIRIANPEKFRASMATKIARLESQKSMTLYRAANYIAAQAKILAPIKSGKLATSIKVRKLKNGYNISVGAQSEYGFKYPKWVNASSGYELVFNRYAGMKIPYGDPSLNWNWTGTRGFFTKAVIRGKEQFKDMVAKDFAKALGTKVGGI